MRLETGSRLPDRAIRLMRVHYALVLLAVVCGVAVWVPGEAGRVLIAEWACVLATGYLWQVAGVYFAGLFSEHEAEQPVAGFGLAMAMPLSLSLVAWLLPLGWTVPLLLAALILMSIIEHLPSQRARWPQAWLQARRQQSQLLAVALASLAVAIWTIGQVY